jgi:dihydrofolate reductase
MINALFAVDQNGGMGSNGSLPWPHNSADLANFKRLTDNNVVVMGSRSWNDPKMPKPLPGRIVYVASTRRVVHAAQIQGDIKEEVLKIEQRHPDKQIFVVGGPEIIEACSTIYDNIYLTHFKGSYKVDTRINLKSFLTGWEPRYASVAQDCSFTFIRYENLFKRFTRGT